MRNNDGSFGIELGGTFARFGEVDEMSRASDLIDEIECQLAAFRKRLWGGIPPEAQARIDRLEAENESLKRNLHDVARELVRLASKERD